MDLYFQVCPNCDDKRTPDCENHMCHNCGLSRYVNDLKYELASKVTIPSSGDELVQYFIVNSELNMSAGKIAAQVAHVATNITVQMSFASVPELDYGMENSEMFQKFNIWLTNNQPKIILRGKQKDLEKLIEQGWYYIHDNGRTEIPEGSLTVAGFPPEYKSVMRPIVKRFQLL